MSRIKLIQMKINHKKATPTMSFWEGEKCEYCGGPIIDKRVTIHRQVNGKHVLLENVPAGVCKECGTRNFSANVLKTIHEILRGRRKAKRQIPVEVFAL